jgi:hypothetical protein
VIARRGIVISAADFELLRKQASGSLSGTRASTPSLQLE